MCISDWLRRTFSAFCQYLFTKIYILLIKIVTGSFLIPVTILRFLSLMALPYQGAFEPVFYTDQFVRLALTVTLLFPLRVQVNRVKSHGELSWLSISSALLPLISSMLIRL